MWLFFVETYLFVLIAFTVGVVVGLVAVRVGVRRQAPAQAAPAPRLSVGGPTEAAAAPAEKKRRGRKGKKDDAAPAETTEAAS